VTLKDFFGEFPVPRYDALPLNDTPTSLYTRLGDSARLHLQVLLLPAPKP
jgi:hypothetical protein